MLKRMQFSLMRQMQTRKLVMMNSSNRLKSQGKVMTGFSLESKINESNEKISSLQRQLLTLSDCHSCDHPKRRRKHKNKSELEKIKDAIMREKQAK